MFSDGMLREGDVSRAGPFVYAPSTVDGLKNVFFIVKNHSPPLIGKNNRKKVLIY
jgi:hypothetical protein